MATTDNVVNMPVKEEDEQVISSLEELKELDEVKYATIRGFLPGKTLRIGSLTASDLMEWTEANEGPAKRTAGLRLICRSLVGPAPENKRYANDDKNIAIFRTKRHAETERIIREILDLNGMRPDRDNASKKD